MTAKRFTMKWNDFMKCNYWLDNGDYLSDCDVTDMLNALHEENLELRLQLNLCSDQRNEFYRGARENANRVGKLEKENKRIKSDLARVIEQSKLEYLKMRYGALLAQTRI